MTVYARIFNGVVAELLDAPFDPNTVVPPELGPWVVVEVPGVEQGWKYDFQTQTFSPPDPVIPIMQPPPSITMRQTRLKLLQLGKLDDVELLIAAASPEIQIEWECAAFVERASPTVALLATELGYTSAEVDALFISAATI